MCQCDTLVCHKVASEVASCKMVVSNLYLSHTRRERNDWTNSHASFKLFLEVSSGAHAWACALVTSNFDWSVFGFLSEKLVIKSWIVGCQYT